ncbi:undecaprenyl-phosphate glucose phosphotransferase [Plesiomonas shigelloides]|uniref:undecaprenyl-phosphate glucose phosphotransferase n=1 Tax=Plesiomonas shigelloides TaxID=703 RepID=UPI0012623EEA|nr:undecaprenyl-phosphate glucose phosphotransferase [Plesiomonas shigelloides]KAB7697297.1 undecaprenyl-phosphate glucose phosphotransferase [Plesiomonas shigelloides]
MNRNIIKFVKNGYGVVPFVCDVVVTNYLLNFHEFGEKIADRTDVSILITLCFLLVAGNVGVYRENIRQHLTHCLFKVVTAWVITAFLLFLMMHYIDFLAEGYADVSVREAALWLSLPVMGSLLSRVVIYGLNLLMVQYGINVRNVAILGATGIGLALEKELDENKELRLRNIGFFDDRDANRFGYKSRKPILGNCAELVRLINEGKVDEVYIALPLEARGRINHYLDQLSDTTVDTYIVPDLYAYSLHHTVAKSVGNISTLSVFSSPFDGIGGFIKRAEDIILGALILLLISPVLLFVAIGVKLSSPGPVLFKQDRYGLGGKCIKVWKFRSMKVMENSDKVVQATRNDPRVTRFGAFIRRTSLDELPQFFNVLQGSMSIVGPRPHAVAHNEEYRAIVNRYMVRHMVKPGITGLAQINGFRGETDTVDKMEMRVKYDLRYIQTWSLALDIKIIFLTIFKGFVGETAY